MSLSSYPLVCDDFARYLEHAASGSPDFSIDTLLAILCFDHPLKEQFKLELRCTAAALATLPSKPRRAHFPLPFAPRGLRRKGKAALPIHVCRIRPHECLLPACARAARSRTSLHDAFQLHFTLHIALAVVTATPDIELDGGELFYATKTVIREGYAHPSGLLGGLITDSRSYYCPGRRPPRVSPTSFL